MLSRLEKIKALLGITADNTEKDMLIEFAIDEAADVITNYCNIVEIPQGLENTLVRMALELYRGQNLGSEEEGQGVVKSISEGDTSVSFGGNSDFKDSLLCKYTVHLNRYRKVKWG